MKKKKSLLVFLLLATLLLSACAGAPSEEETQPAPTEAAQHIPQTLPEGAKMLAWQGDVAWFKAVTDRYGLIHRDGTILSEPLYLMVAPFVNGYAMVRRGASFNEAGFVNFKGELVVDAIYHSLTPMSPDGFALASQYDRGSDDFQAVVVDNQGSELFRYKADDVSDIHAFAGGIALFKGSSDWYGVNTKGELILDKVRNPTVFDNGFASCEVLQDEGDRRMYRWAIVSASGQMLINRDWEALGQVGEGLLPISINEQWGYVDTSGQVVIQPQWDECKHFTEGLAAVRKGSNWGYINLEGQVVIQPNWVKATPFDQGAAIVENVDAYIIDTKGEVVFGPIVDEYIERHRNVSQFHNGFASIQGIETGTGYYEYNRRGTLINTSGEYPFGYVKGRMEHLYADFYLSSQDIYNTKGEVVGYWYE